MNKQGRLRSDLEQRLDEPPGTTTRSVPAEEGITAMRYINALALLLVIVGAANWLLVGVAKFDLVAALTGTSFGETNAISSVIYILVGISGLVLLPVLARWATASSTPTR